MGIPQPDGSQKTSMGRMMSLNGLSSLTVMTLCQFLTVLWVTSHGPTNVILKQYSVQLFGSLLITCSL